LFLAEDFFVRKEVIALPSAVLRSEKP